MIRICPAILLVVCFSVVGHAADRLLPVDEGPNRADFLAFRQTLRSAVSRRDADELLRHVHPDIKNTFGGDDGIEAFKRIWRLGAPDSELWEELNAVLRLGGRFEGDETFIAPYVFSSWPDVDSFANVAVIGSNVRVRARPSLDAAILSRESYSILRLRGNDARDSWTAVLLPDGRPGFVASRLVRSPIDYRAYFMKSGERWQLTMFVAGD